MNCDKSADVNNVVILKKGALEGRLRRLRDSSIRKQAEYDEVKKCLEADIMEAEARFGTSDISELRAMLDESKANLESALRTFDSRLDCIHKKLKNPIV